MLQEVLHPRRFCLTQQDIVEILAAVAIVTNKPQIKIPGTRVEKKSITAAKTAFVVHEGFELFKPPRIHQKSHQETWHWLLQIRSKLIPARISPDETSAAVPPLIGGHNRKGTKSINKIPIIINNSAVVRNTILQ